MNREVTKTKKMSKRNRIKGNKIKLVLAAGVRRVRETYPDRIVGTAHRRWDKAPVYHDSFVNTRHQPDYIAPKKVRAAA